MRKFVRRLLKAQRGNTSVIALIVACVAILSTIVFVSISTNIGYDYKINRCIEVLDNAGYWVLAGGSHSVPGDLLPSNDNTYDIGSGALSWADGFFDGAIYTNGCSVASLTSGRVVISGAGGVLTHDAELTYNSTTDTLTASNIDSPTGRAATYVIAANDSTALEKAQADYVCDGTADNVEIQAAVDALPATGGKIYFCAGEYVCAAPILLNNLDFITLHGAGYSSYIRSIDNANWTEPPDVSDALINCESSEYILFEDLRLLIYSNNGAAECIDGDRSKNLTVDHCWLYVKNAGACIRFDGETETCSDGKLINSYLYSNNIGVNVMAKAGGTCTRTLIANNVIVPWEENGAGGNDSGIMLGHPSYTPTEVSRTIITGNILGGTYKFWPGLSIYASVIDTVIDSNQISSMANCVQFLATNYRTIITSNDFRGVSASGVYGTNYAADLVCHSNQNYLIPGEVRFASGTLTAGNANAICFAWSNTIPGGFDILIKKVVIEVTTAGGTAGSHLDVGIADDITGTNRGTEFFDDLLLNSVQINDSYLAGDGGTQTKWVFCQDSASATDRYIVGQILDANAANLVGRYYIEYVCR